MCKWGTVTVVATPDWLWGERAEPENGVAIDSCIAVTLLAAWEAGVRTLGSCCGHGKEPPNVVLTADEQTELAVRMLPGFRLYRWELVDLAAPVSVLRGLLAAANEAFDECTGDHAKGLVADEPWRGDWLAMPSAWRQTCIRITDVEETT